MTDTLTTSTNWNILGHEWAVDMLHQHAARGEFRHAYLFCGPPGLGRRTLALRFAQALNCSSPLAPGVPCGACRDCKQIEGMRSVRTRPTTRRLPAAGPITFGRGVEVELEVDEFAFRGASPFLFGSVMDHFLARHVSINSFTETVLRSQERGEVMRWRPRCGSRPIL